MLGLTEKQIIVAIFVTVACMVLLLIGYLAGVQYILVILLGGFLTFRLQSFLEDKSDRVHIAVGLLTLLGVLVSTAAFLYYRPPLHNKLQDRGSSADAHAATPEELDLADTDVGHASAH